VPAIVDKFLDKAGIAVNAVNGGPKLQFFSFLKNESTGFGRQLMLVGVFAGGVSTALMFLLTNAAERVAAGLPVRRSLMLTIVCLVGYWVSKGWLLRRTTQMVEEIVEKIRLRIADKVKRSDLVALETIGVAPIYNAIATHPLNISKATPGIISSATSFVLIICACTFIRFYSVGAFYAFLLTLGFIICLLMFSGKKVIAILEKTTAQDNEFVTSFDDLLKGFKEIKMNSAKSEEFFASELRPLAHDAKVLRTETGRIVSETALIASSALFILLAVIVFLLPVLSPHDAPKIASIATLIVFIFGPLSEVVSVYPHFTQAEGSIRAIYQVEAQLQSFFEKDFEQTVNPDGPIEDFEVVRCENLTFDYYDEKKQKTFSLEPINFTLRKGEMVFITGGNGSGKSTFLKVLAGLYPAANGKIFINDALVGPHNRQSFRDLFAPVFSDFHLFRRLFGIPEPSQAKIYELLDLAELSDKTQIVGRKFTNLTLSTGQRKRLALVAASLEDKPIYLFDEWAAEQDPNFRRKFYEQILPAMKAQGKTILAVTHDDDYYGVADRVIKMQYGRIVESTGRKKSRAA
jgi:putative ATP-binding cassette transporter